MTTCLAVDQATVTGWTFGGTKIDLKDWVSGHFRALKRPLMGERLILIEDETIKLIDRFLPDILVYETPFDPTVTNMKRGTEDIRFSRSTMNFLQRVAGAIEMAAARRSVPVENYGVQSWRSALHLPSSPHLTLEDIKARAEVAEGEEPAKPKFSAKKKLTFEAVRRLGAQVSTFDEADSWGLCYYTLHGKAGQARAQDDLLARARAI